MHTSDKGHRFTNALIHEQSPYLLQHAHNPVHWMAWSDHALSLAQQQNKPILLSIGYAACHWCHVMERESFEDEQVANFMNEHFINIKVDREERPDIDHIYMDALQAMTGAGGWPLNIFLFPDGKPFYGGTYFPPKAMYNRASWMDVLNSIKNAYVNHHEQLLEQANNLTSHLIQSNIKAVATNEDISLESYDVMIQRMFQNADTEWGGFGGAPKFPQTFSLQALLRNYLHTKDNKFLQQVELSMQKMIQGGMYDQIQGGFARYSTDGHWQVPHFEKMLYDNALLLGILAELYQITKKELYLKVIEQTIGFLDAILKDTFTGAYFSAIDADSEGVEGKYYVWTYEELQSILTQDQFEKCQSYFNINEQGNWEGVNVLWSTRSIDSMFDTTLHEVKEILLQHRNKRVAPSIDQKIIFSWNALLVIAFAKVYAATSIITYKERAIQLLKSLEKQMISNGSLKHVVTNGIFGKDAFIEDVSLYIQACIQIHQITGETSWLHKAKQWMEMSIHHFSDEEGVYFYFTSSIQKDIIIRKKDFYDGAMGSANAMQTLNLMLLSHVFDVSEWKERAQKMMGGVLSKLMKYPGSFGLWAQAYYLMGAGYIDVVGVGKNAPNELFRILSIFNPQVVPFFQEHPDQGISLLKFKQSTENQYFMCKNETCSPPVKDIQQILANI